MDEEENELQSVTLLLDNAVFQPFKIYHFEPKGQGHTGTICSRISNKGQSKGQRKVIE